MGLHSNIHDDPISELELRDILAVKRGATLRSVSDEMRRRRLGCAIVVDEAGKPVGKFTERRLMRLMLSNPRGLDETVDQHMYRDADCIARTSPIADMVELMRTKQLRFICVVDEAGRAVALTGQKGLVEYVAEHFPRQIKVQEMESKLSMDQREGA